MELTNAEPGARSSSTLPEHFDAVVIGGGQAGLSVGYFLARQGLRFVILDASERIGDSWRKRWDSLRLFTPAKFDALVGMPFPAPPSSFPTKDQMGDYLEAYAAKFELPVRSGVRVHRLSRQDGTYVVETNEGVFEAAHVVVAMANYQQPRVPSFASQLSPDIVQLHAHAYRSPEQLREGDVLVVGGGNSGVEIAMDLHEHHRVLVSGRDTGALPFAIDGWASRIALGWLVLRVFFHRVLSVKTPLGRKIRPKVLSRGGPLIRTKNADLQAVGIERVSRTAGARDGKPVLEDGRVLDVASVVWCTGFTPGFSWIDLPVFDDHGHPRHDAGIVPEQPGLYFVGLHFLFSLSSTMIHGVGRDAERIVSTIAERVQIDGAERPRVAKTRAG